MSAAGNVRTQTSHKKPVVYFPVEITTREYAGHVVLGTHLAARGLRVVIGHREIVNSLVAAADTPGIVFFKGDEELRTLKNQYRNPKLLFVGQDPEMGIVPPSFRDFYETRPVVQNVDTSSAYFCFGPEDFEFLSQRHPEAPLHNLGSPRVWLWGPAGAHFFENEIERIRGRYGHFFLLIDSSTASFELVSKAAELARATGCQVVIRPHPASNAGEYARRAATVKGVNVETAFELNAWIRSSSVTVALGSTASFEAWFADVPVISDYRLAGDSTARSPQGLTPDLIALTPRLEESVFEAIPNARNRWDSHRARSDLAGVIARKVLEPEKIAVPAIADVIVDLAHEGFVTRGPGRARLRREIYSFAKASLRASDDFQFRYRSPQPRVPIKRSRITVSRAQRHVSWVSNHFNLPNVSVWRGGPNCIVIE